MIPDIYVRAHWLRDYSAALWAPRYTPDGFVVYDTEPGLLAALRAAVDDALADRASLMPELYTTANAYRNGVAMPARWLTAPPADGESPKRAHTVAAVYSAPAAAAVKRLHADMRPFVEQVVGRELRATEWYGPRLYGPGSVLVGHLDKHPEHMVSVSLTVRCDKPWHMQMLDLSIAGGRATRQITTDETKVVVYEGCRVIHARMTPYDGQRYIGAYLHYVPTDFSADGGRLLAQQGFLGGPSGRAD